MLGILAELSTLYFSQYCIDNYFSVRVSRLDFGVSLSEFLGRDGVNAWVDPTDLQGVGHSLEDSIGR
jgi:hypothetical protein